MKFGHQLLIAYKPQGQSTSRALGRLRMKGDYSEDGWQGRCGPRALWVTAYTSGFYHVGGVLES